MKLGINLIRNIVSNINFKTIITGSKIMLKSIGILLITLIGNLFPLWSSVFFLVYLKQPFEGFSFIYDHGDLLICSASLITSVFLLKPSTYLLSFCGFLLLTLGYLYSGVCFFYKSAGTISIDMNMLKLGSLIILIISCLSYLYMIYQDQKIKFFNPRETAQQNTDRLINQFNNLED